MKILPLHKNFRLPERSTTGSGGYDLFMPEGGCVYFGDDFGSYAPLGFAMEVPANHVALLLPRSGVGCKGGLELNNTCGVIDSDYRGEVMACLRIKNSRPFGWDAGDRLIQMLIVPVATPELEVVTDLDKTDRNGGFGSTGK